MLSKRLCLYDCIMKKQSLYNSLIIHSHAEYSKEESHTHRDYGYKEGDR
jgi:hypothetical protein